MPESGWWASYYHPVEKRLCLLRTRHAGNAENLSIVQSVQKEIDICRQNSAYYGKPIAVRLSVRDLPT